MVKEALGIFQEFKNVIFNPLKKIILLQYTQNCLEINICKYKTMKIQNSLLKARGMILYVKNSGFCFQQG